MNQCENHPSCYETCTESDILVALVIELTFSPCLLREHEGENLHSAQRNVMML